MPVKTNCAECGAIVQKRWPSELSERNFCNKACLGRYRSKHYVGPKAANWKGGMRLDRQRVQIYRPEHPRADGQGYIYRYRIVAEEMLGRLLTEKEIVHHIDGDESNDEPSNLLVITQSEHARFYDARRPRRAAL